VIVMRAMGLFEHVANERSIAFEAELPEHLPAVSADVGRVTQLLANLIGNALKFTPPGGRVVARACEEPNGVRVDVTDTGPGIPASDLPYIFDRFWHAQRSAKVRGTGLGLTIARGVAEAHGSTLDVESVVGRGTTFTFRLPFAEPSAAPRPR
jgi:signal transduction histidine kinase